VEDPQKDLRSVGSPTQPYEPGLEPLETPEPLVIPPDELREQYLAEYEQMKDDEVNRIYFHLAEYVKVQSLGQVLSFMRLHMKMYNEARELLGFADGGIRGKWWAKRFWTYTTWESREDMERFMNGGVHADLASRMREVAAPGSCYIVWEAKGESDWPGALSRLEHPTRYYVDPYFG
jgi:hypothetical protein